MHMMSCDIYFARMWFNPDQVVHIVPGDDTEYIWYRLHYITIGILFINKSHVSLFVSGNLSCGSGLVVEGDGGDKIGERGMF